MNIFSICDIHYGLKHCGLGFWYISWCICVYIYIYIYMHIYIYVCVCVYMCVCVSVYMIIYKENTCTRHMTHGEDSRTPPPSFSTQKNRCPSEYAHGSLRLLMTHGKRSELCDTKPRQGQNWGRGEVLPSHKAEGAWEGAAEVLNFKAG